jgi:hypothetical protein
VLKPFATIFQLYLIYGVVDLYMCGGGGVKTPPGIKSLTNLSPTSVSSNASPQTVINPQDLDGDMH